MPTEKCVARILGHQDRRRRVKLYDRASRDGLFIRSTMLRMSHLWIHDTQGWRARFLSGTKSTDGVMVICVPDVLG